MSDWRGDGFMLMMLAEAGCALLPFAVLLVGLGVWIGWLIFRG